MSNLPQPVDCENANCHLNAHNVRYWFEAFNNKSKDYAIEVDKGHRRDGNIIDLNREVQKLQKEIQTLQCNQQGPKDDVCAICNNIDYRGITWKQEVSRSNEALQFRTKLIQKEEEIKLLKEKIHTLETTLKA